MDKKSLAEKTLRQAFFASNVGVGSHKRRFKLFENFRRNSAATRLVEEQLYEQVVVELSKGQKQDGLWAKAFANSDGIEEKAKALYICYRVQSIKDEMEISEALAEEAEHQRQNASVIERQKQINAAESLKNGALKTLSDRGYHAKLMPFGWKVTQPQGGWLEINSTEELIDFAKSIEQYKIIK